MINKVIEYDSSVSELVYSPQLLHRGIELPLTGEGLIMGNILFVGHL
jgi:hypothetical protein